jgi:hypothetical protein
LKLTPVDSSHIAAIGYLEDERVLLVRYKDGSLYAQSQVLPSEYAELMIAPSKGRWLLTKGLRWGAQLSPRLAHADNASPSAGVLNVIDEDADKCCRRQLTSFFGGAPSNAEHFECSACGTNFKPVMVGPSRHWRIVPLLTVHRMGK